jgi:DNA-binding CsgD family transcriptional regulator
MKSVPGSWLDRSGVMISLILLQLLCAFVFLVDIWRDAGEYEKGSLTLWHFLPELAATLGLFIGILVEVRILLRLLRRQAHIEQALSVARGALTDVMEQYFRDWGLTPSEQDIATFTIKGFSIAEIARLRGSAEATVKTHLHAIYRKAGVAGRGQLVSLLIEDLMRGPLVAGTGEADSRQGSADSIPRSGLVS